jgi:hypothetical protein
MKQIKEIGNRREWMSVPGPGTLTYAIDSALWDRISGQTCCHCRKLIGHCCGVYVYFPRVEAAHARCTDEAEAKGIGLRSNAFMVDAAAKLAGIPQEAFRNLAVWEKDRLIKEVQANTKEQAHGNR